jgi:hypothetical protein
VPIIPSKQDRQIDSLLTDHYDRLTHPPQNEPDFNFTPVYNKLKCVISSFPKPRPINRTNKPKLQP